MKVSDYIIKFLEEKNIKNCYMLVGGGAMFLNEAFRKSNIKIIPVLHEQAASICSDADNQYSNKLNSVVCITTGPGGTNAITGVLASYLDSIPLFILSGQTKSIDLKKNHFNVRQYGVQENDIISMVKNITKYAVTIENAKDIKYILNNAYDLAIKGRKGPVWIDIPLDIQNAEVDENKLSCFGPIDTRNWKSYYDAIERIPELINLLNNSKRPVILAGNGIRLSSGLEKFKELIEKLRIPILTTWKSLDFLSQENNSNYGRPGIISSRYANKILQASDLFISIGAKIDTLTCAYNYSNFAPKAKKVIVDIDQSEIDKLEFEKELIFNIEAKIFIEKLLEKINEIDSLNYREWRTFCTTIKCGFPIFQDDYSLKDKINPYLFIKELSKILKDDDIIVPDSSGSAAEITLQSIELKENQRVISSPNLGSMGFQLPHAIGAAIASNKRVICIAGDGSIQMNIQELQTIKNNNLKIKIFVFSNNGYSSIRNTQSKFFGKDNLIACDESCGLKLPDLQQLCNGYNIQYFKLNNNKDVTTSLENILNSPFQIFVCECLIDPQISTQPRVQSYVDEDGKIVSGKLENMWPFINE